MDLSNRESDKSIFATILDIVRSIPYGQVATYGQIAEKVGTRNARLVGYALSGVNSPHDGLPWHRVINRFGKISFRPGDSICLQKELLISEGIKFDSEGRVDLEKYGWRVKQ
ncbi:MAG: MGMT family protein [Chloroflexota bacterium]|nr:MGMT family protein [Chloroflexota bacterium]